jgi:hypothetical protein
VTTESDELLFMVRRFVKDRVEPRYEAIVTEGIVRTLVVMMSDPRFYTRLSIVSQLQMENEMLRMHLANATAALARYQPVKVAPKKKRPAKKSTAKRRPVATNPPVAVKRAFKQGYRGR